MAENVKKWYVLVAMSGKEKTVRDYLEKEIKNEKDTEFGKNVFQVIVPVEKYRTTVAGKSVIKERTYLPGYVLVEASLVGEVAYKLRNTPDVFLFVGEKRKNGQIIGAPAALRQNEVNRILGRAEEMPEDEISMECPYTEGESVKVKEGPFAGFSATVEEINLEKRKLKVKVKIFGRPTPLELGYEQVEKE